MKLCPHLFGWSYNTHRTRRWCRLCGQQQRREKDEQTDERRWVDVPDHDDG